jgi:hypothetical protein
MANKYENQITRARVERDRAIIIEISKIFDSIREKSQRAAMKVTDKAGDNTEWFSDRAGRTEKFAKELNEELRPDYLKKDNFSKQVYAEEYRTSYFESLYSITNEGISEGFLVKLPRYTKKQFEKAIRYPLSKLMNNPKMKTSRNVDIEQIYTTIVSGIEQGLSLPNINKDLDIALGYRDSSGKWIAKKELRKGQTYRTTRTLRTEILRMRSTAETDQWINQQPIVESKLQLIETLDDRTRSQSANMDGQIANKEGKFKFPDISDPRFAHRSGNPAFDINDRATTITLDPDFPPESRIERDPVTGKNKVVPYKDFKTYAGEKGLVKNKYGQYLFGKPAKSKPSAVKPRAKSVRPKTPTRQTTSTRQRIRDVDVLSKDSENLLLKKSGHSMKLTDNIAEEFGVTRNRVLNVEASFIKKFPRRKLNIDQLRGLVVDDMSKEIERLKRALKK